MTFSFFVLPKLLRNVRSSLVNLPHRDYWLAPERREKAFAMLSEEMAWFGNAILAMMIYTFQLAIEANLPGRGGFRSDDMWVLLVGFFAFTGIWLLRLYRRFAVPRN